MTSSPGPTSKAAKDNANASVPLFKATQNSVPQNFATAASKSSTTTANIISEASIFRLLAEALHVPLPLALKST